MAALLVASCLLGGCYTRVVHDNSPEAKLGRIFPNGLDGQSPRHSEE